MGTDIHMFVEKKTSEGWEAVKGENPYYIPGDEYGDEEYRYEGWLYNSRNYDFFAMLAGVRNGSGFAGVDTGEGFNPISEPKGLPKDASVEVEDYFDDSYLHSKSWLSLKELKDYDLQQTTTQRGYIHEDDFEEYKELGRPLSGYFGGVAGVNVIPLTEEEYESLSEKEEGKEYFIRVEWEVTYKDCVGDTFEDIIYQLEDIGEPIRIVFGFDN